MKIFCIGRNYADHIAELNNQTPEAPVIFLKPPTALLTSDKPFYLPNFSQDIHYEGELVFRFCKNGKQIQQKFAHTYYDAVTVGIDVTARDLQQHQKQNGLPWEIAKAFDNSAIIGKWVTLTDDQKQTPLQFELYKNGTQVQHGDTALLLHSVHYIIHYISTFFTIHQGDILFTGTPKGVGKLAIGDNLQGIFQSQQVLHVDIK